MSIPFPTLDSQIILKVIEKMNAQSVIRFSRSCHDAIRLVERSCRCWKETYVLWCLLSRHIYNSKMPRWDRIRGAVELRDSKNDRQIMIPEKESQMTDFLYQYLTGSCPVDKTRRFWADTRAKGQCDPGKEHLKTISRDVLLTIRATDYRMDENLPDYHQALFNLLNEVTKKYLDQIVLYSEEESSFGGFFRQLSQLREEYRERKEGDNTEIAYSFSCDSICCNILPCDAIIMVKIPEIRRKEEFWMYLKFSKIVRMSTY